MRRLIFSMFLIGMFISPTYVQANEYVLTRIIKSRPSKKQNVYDYAGLLKFSKENKEEALQFFDEKYGVEMILVTMPGLEGHDILTIATTLFTNWEIGAEYGGKGVLILLADQEKQVKVEVGLEAEAVYTDLFCGYIERKQIKPYFENNQVDLGLSATMEEFIGRAEGRLTDDDIKRKMGGYLSAGAGIKKDIKIGELTKRASIEDQQKAFYSARTTSEELAKRWIESLKQCMNDPFVSMYTEESQILLNNRPKMSRSLCQSQYQLYSQPWEIKEKAKYAVLLYPKGKKQGPILMKQTGLGWQIDIWSTSNWIRYDHKNEWYLGGRNHPYAFAFKKEPYKSRVYDRDFYDDFSWFSSIKGNYLEAIKTFEDRLNENPDDFETLIKLAELQFDLKNAKKAIPLLKKAIETHPKDARAYRYLGLFSRDYFVSKKTALDHLRKYAQLAPDDPTAYHYLAVTHWRLGGKKNPFAYIKAAENMKKFTALSGNRRYGYKMVGYFYYKGRNYRKAEKWFKKVVEIDETNEYALQMINKIKRK